jgi:hypothetical protein
MHHVTPASGGVFTLFLSRKLISLVAISHILLEIGFDFITSETTVVKSVYTL